MNDIQPPEDPLEEIDKFICYNVSLGNTTCSLQFCYSFLGAAVGLLLPSEMPATQIGQFESLMKDLTAMQTSEFTALAPTQETSDASKQPKSNLTSTNISNGLVKGEIVDFLTTFILIC